MIVRPIKTTTVLPKSISLLTLLDQYVIKMEERSVLAVTSKVVSLCEGAVVLKADIDKHELIRTEADLYADLPENEHDLIFTVVNNTLMPNAGIDESNAGDVYVIWPRDPQKTANEIRAYLSRRFGLKEVGVIITDSTARPLRWGVGGISIAHSGFKEINDYRGQPDLFGRQFTMATAAVATNLAAAAVLVMGEGSESTPLAMVSDIPFVQFQDHDPLPDELASTRISIENDVFAPILKSAAWKSKP
jgi:F420-0:gamma-glutamyl ligase